MGDDTQLDEKEEAEFQEWYSSEAKKRKLNPDPDNPLHYYDYRGFYRAQKRGQARIGIEEETGEEEFPDRFKKEGHPTKGHKTHFGR